MATTWEQRMAAKAHARQSEQERAELEEKWRADDEWRAQAEAERIAWGEVHQPPNGCRFCYEVQRSPVTPAWQWRHKWPEELYGPTSYICTHECHGPGGEEQVLVAFA